MIISLELYDNEYTLEAQGEDYDSDQLKRMFSRLLVTAGFSPSVIETEDDGGRYEFVRDDEEVVRKDIHEVNDNIASL